MGTKYRTTRDNNWRRIVRRDFRIACCGCGLVHSMLIRLTPKNAEAH
jgi:hypothetical protein